MGVGAPNFCVIQRSTMFLNIDFGSGKVEN